MQSTDRGRHFIHCAGEEEERKAVDTRSRTCVFLWSRLRLHEIHQQHSFSGECIQRRKTWGSQRSEESRPAAVNKLWKNWLQKCLIDDHLYFIINTREESSKAHIQKHTHTHEKKMIGSVLRVLPTLIVIEALTINGAAPEWCPKKPRMCRSYSSDSWPLLDYCCHIAVKNHSGSKGIDNYFNRQSVANFSDRRGCVGYCHQQRSFSTTAAISLKIGAGSLNQFYTVRLDEIQWMPSAS